VVAIVKRVNFLNIEKDRNTLAIKRAEKKGRLLTELTFFFAALWKCKLLNPRSARCARYAWGLAILAANLCPKRFYYIMVHLFLRIVFCFLFVIKKRENYSNCRSN
jgi:hypothetical protein